MRKIITILMTILLASCSKEEVCTETQMTMAGNVVSIEGPAEMNIGETAALTIGIAAQNDYCVQKAEGVIGKVNYNYVQVTGNLIYTGLRNKSSCTCYDQSTLHTLLYFTPTARGDYIFGTKEQTNATPEGVVYRIRVN